MATISNISKTSSSLSNTSKTSSSISNVSKTTAGSETWASIATTWATEVRTWAGMAGSGSIQNIAKS